MRSVVRLMVLAVVCFAVKAHATNWAQFGYFSVAEISPYGGTIRFGQTDQLEGRIHTNGRFVESPSGNAGIAGFVTQCDQSVSSIPVDSPFPPFSLA